MPQNPNPVYMAAPGGQFSALNIAAVGVIKTGQRTLYRLTVNAVGSAGTLTLNDAATVGAANAGNQILTVPFGSLTSGQVINLDWPCAAGIVVSGIPTGGSIEIAYS